MRMRQIGQEILVHLFTGYLKLLEKTVNVQWAENSMCGGSQIFGFWHEDSFFMNLVLAELAKQTSPVDVIVTADTRGDYIEKMIKRCGGSALRVPDGFASFGALKGILQNAYERTRSIAVALDGPLGPRHEPKKLAFYLSEQAQEDFVGISVSYSSKLRLGWRWDKYVIPLPFSTVTVAAHNYGEVDKKHIPELPTSANAPECGILVKEI
ncbi:hypothetical protein GCM10008910_14350 [Faecalicatena orotica]|nr:hypothetical protein [Faecalicatena orotica]